jgi:hypothetical protein
MPPKQAPAAEASSSANRGSLSPTTLAQNISKLSLNEVARTPTPPVVATREPFTPSSDEEDTSSDSSSDDDMSNGSNSIFKKKEPTTFNGEATKFKSFMVQLKLEFKVGSKRFKNEEDKVLYAASLLEGRASTWFQAYLEEYLDDDVETKSDKTKYLFAKFDNFRSELKAFSGVQSEEKEAERKMYNLRQTGSVSTYAAQFRSLTTLLDWNDGSLASHFYRGLKDEIKREYISREKPDTLQGLIDDATLLDNNISEYKAEQGQARALPFKRNTSNAPNQAKPRQPYYGPMPMELDQTERKPGKKRFKKGEKLSQAEKERRFKKGHCTYCDKPGHRAKDHNKDGTIKQHQNSSVEPKEPKPKAKKAGQPIEVHSISSGSRRLLREPSYFINGGKAEILSITDHCIHIRTRYWKEVECPNPQCILDAQHKHTAYAPHQNAQDGARILSLEVCEKEMCSMRTNNPDDLHVHAWDNQAVPITDYTVGDSLEELEPQLMSSEASGLPPVDEESESDSSEEEDDDLDQIQNLFYDILMAEHARQEQVQATQRQVQGIIDFCTRQGALVPKIIDTVRIDFAWALYPCHDPITCMMRRIPHVHQQHFDPTTPWKGLTILEAERQSVAQPGQCQKPWCTTSTKNHFHDSGNEQAE